MTLVPGADFERILVTQGRSSKGMPGRDAGD
jgi:hypothetical protein